MPIPYPNAYGDAYKISAKRSPPPSTQPPVSTSHNEVLRLKKEVQLLKEMLKKANDVNEKQLKRIISLNTSCAVKDGIIADLRLNNMLQHLQPNSEDASG